MHDDSPVRTGRVRRPHAWIAGARLLPLVAILLALDVAAIEMPALYTVQVPLDAEDENPRATAYERGLWEVVIRVTGSEIPADAALLDELFPNPAQYVLQFRQAADDMLSISYDGVAIERVLRAAGQTVWGPERPLTLIWLAVDWGDGEREIVGADDPQPLPGASRSIDRSRLLRERLQFVASRRGIPVAFPLLDAEDREAIRFADVWGGFDEQLLQASTRYQANSILVGRVRPVALHRNRWTYHFRGIQEEWSGTPEDAMNYLADRLAAEFAFSGSAPLESVTLIVSGIDSVRAYGRVQQFLEALSLIEDVDVRAVVGDRIRYEIQLRGGPARLRRALELSDILIAVEDSDDPSLIDPFPTTGALEFMYRAPGRSF